MLHHLPGLRVALSLLALALAAAHPAHAEDASAPASDWKLSGFGTLGATHSSEHDADYTNSVLKASGAGATRPWSADVDSRLGVQLDVSLTREWSAVVQLVSEQRLNNSYRPQVEWANIKYQVTPDLALRVGRIAIPMYLTADYRNVGYAYPWVRPPIESYGALPFTSSDGVDATLRWDLGRVRNASQVFYGYTDLKLVAPLHAYTRGLVGVSNTSDWDAWSVRMNYVRAEVTTNLGQQLFDALNAFGPAGQALTQRYAIDHKVAAMANIGLTYDPGTWFVMAEAGRVSTHSLLGKTHSAYLSGGWRWRAFTPYATYSRVRARGATTDAGLATDGLPAALAGQVAQLDGGLDTLLATIAQQTSMAAGVRWDLRTNLALKVQYDRVRPVDGSRGTLINTTAGFRSNHPFNVASATLDFVF